MSIPDTTVRLLEAVSYFADLDADILQTIALRCQSKSLLSRRPVFMEGDPCKHLYILESGCVKFYRSRTSKAALGQSATTLTARPLSAEGSIPDIWRDPVHL